MMRKIINGYLTPLVTAREGESSDRLRVSGACASRAGRWAGEGQAGCLGDAGGAAQAGRADRRQDGQMDGDNLPTDPTDHSTLKGRA